MILLDTNILARSAQPGHSQYQSAIAAVDTLRLRNETLCLVPQVLYEYWVVATRPVEQNGLGMTAAEAAATSSPLFSDFTCIEMNGAFSMVGRNSSCNTKSSARTGTMHGLSWPCSDMAFRTF